MDYQKIYNDIINNAKNRNINSHQYFEMHHIIPKCIGGKNDNGNLVQLTLREHFICHALLVKIYPNNNSLKCALWIICTTTLEAKKEYITNNIKYKNNIPINNRVKHFLNDFEKHINISSRDYEYCRTLYYITLKDKKNKKRTIEQCKKISDATKHAMQDPSRVQLRRKGVLGSKFYYDLITNKSYKWFPGDPDIDLNKYAWGRGKKMSLKSKTLMSENLSKYKKVYYYNDNLKSSTCFCKDQIKILPDSWHLGRKYGGYNKMKTFIIPLLRNVHFKLVCNQHFIDNIFYHINLLNKQEISIGILTINEKILSELIQNNIDINDEKYITIIYNNILNNISQIKTINNSVYLNSENI